MGEGVRGGHTGGPLAASRLRSHHAFVPERRTCRFASLLRRRSWHSRGLSAPSRLFGPNDDPSPDSSGSSRQLSGAPFSESNLLSSLVFFFFLVPDLLLKRNAVTFEPLVLASDFESSYSSLCCGASM